MNNYVQGNPLWPSTVQMNDMGLYYTMLDSLVFSIVDFSATRMDLHVDNADANLVCSSDHQLVCLSMDRNVSYSYMLELLTNLVLIQGVDFDRENCPSITFPRSLPGKVSFLPLHVKNNGILHATGRIDMEPNEAFLLEGGSRVFSVESKKVEMFKVAFCPSQVAQIQHELHIKVIVCYITSIRLAM